jgi:hypothetical protein
MLRVRTVANANLLIGLLAAVAVLSRWDARAQAPSPPATRAAPPDAAIESARVAFEALAETERKDLQDALVWTGEYAGVVDGTFGRNSYASIMAYQRRSGRTPDGVLDQKARADLREAGRRVREAAGFRLLDDTRSGVQIGVPTRILTKEDVNPNGGSRWQSADGRITLDTRTADGGDGAVQALFDRNLSIQTAGRKVTYKLLRPDFFVVAGETATGRFYTRYSSGPSGLRGFSIGYDKALSKDADRLVAAIANSFVPFPPSLPPQGVAEAKAETLPAMAGTGLAVTPRRVLTWMRLGDCPGMQVAGMKPMQVRAVADGPTILDLTADVPSVPLRLATEPLQPKSRLLVLAYRAQGADTNLVAVPGVSDAATVLAPLQPGSLGAPVFDTAGRLRGLVASMPDARKATAGIIPPSRFRLATEGLSEFLGTPAPEPQQDAASVRTAGEIARTVRAAVVPVACSS